MLLPTTGHRQRSAAPWRLTWTPFPTRAWSLAASFIRRDQCASTVKGLLLGTSPRDGGSRSASWSRLPRRQAGASGDFPPVSLPCPQGHGLRRQSTVAVPAHTPALWRFAHPHRNTPQCPERALRNVNDIVGYGAPRTPCPRRSQTIQTHNIPCVALGPET